MMDNEQIQRENAKRLLIDYRAGKISELFYGSMIVQWGKAHLLEARPDIEPFLHSSDADIRSSALDVLAGRFRLQEYWSTAVQFLLYDPEYIPRVTGANALAWLKANTKDPRTLGVLASVVQDPYDYELIRDDAYYAMRIIAFGNWESLGTTFDLERDADWEFVKACIDPTLEEDWRTEAQEWLEQFQAGKIAEQDYYATLLRFGRTKLQAAREVVESFLKSPIELLRTTALHVIILYLQIPGNWQMAVDLLQHASEPTYRQEGATLLGLLMRNTRDKRTLRILKQFTEDDDVWMDVFDAMQKIYPGDYDDLLAFLASPEEGGPSKGSPS